MHHSNRVTSYAVIKSSFEYKQYGYHTSLHCTYTPVYTLLLEFHHFVHTLKFFTHPILFFENHPRKYSGLSHVLFERFRNLIEFKLVHVVTEPQNSTFITKLLSYKSTMLGFSHT